MMAKYQSPETNVKLFTEGTNNKNILSNLEMTPSNTQTGKETSMVNGKEHMLATAQAHSPLDALPSNYALNGLGKPLQHL